MNMRMKQRYFLGHTKSGVYDPNEPVLPGCDREEERKALNEQFKQKKITLEQIKARVKTWKSKQAPVMLTMTLRHGDIVIMHGAEMQKYYEVSVSFICRLSSLTFRLPHGRSQASCE